ncbi:hypothetical protein NPIL_579101 [Nephila pilipes]|uniref:Uncharacterized protein n=1 Tax=Nephila pilipes TaxID=299642 RepID=A0A8X6TWH9_NEPPI|nr:hypothetical protein NPIL_579101 [Nephila pilipes]
MLSVQVMSSQHSSQPYLTPSVTTPLPATSQSVIALSLSCYGYLAAKAALIRLRLKRLCLRKHAKRGAARRYRQIFARLYGQQMNATYARVTAPGCQACCCAVSPAGSTLLPLCYGFGSAYHEGAATGSSGLPYRYQRHGRSSACEKRTYVAARE